MEEINLRKKIINGAKWSILTELAAKLISPITNMILARLIAPEAFGIIATITMIVSFADMLSDSGFQKYLIQHKFINEKEKDDYAHVAFWTNLGISLFLWGIIFVFRDNIAIIVGNPGLGNVLAIACIQLPITAFSSIQMALYRRDFDFRTLFMVRMISIFIPIFITIPLAFMEMSYWSLIAGTLIMQLSNAFILTLKSKWKPKFFYKISILKTMISFSGWSLIEAISIWLTTWIDTFIIGKLLNSYQVGLYKTPTTTVNAIMSLITASTVPVLFSALSRYQDESENFKKLYFKFQRLVSILVFPLGIGIFLYSDLVTNILLGSQWENASKVVGIWGLTSSMMIVLGHFCSEVYRAKGKPKLSFFAQVMHLIFLIPTCLIAGQYGFWALVYARSLIRLQFVLVHFIIMKKVIGIKVLETVNNVLPTFTTSIAMGLLGYYLKSINDTLIWTLFSILICIIFYFGSLMLFPKIRLEIIGLIMKLNINNWIKNQILKIKLIN